MKTCLLLVVLGMSLSGVAAAADVAKGKASFAICSACHVSSLAAEHMKQNGGDFEATKAPDSTLISSGVETCELCHGEGGIADVEAVHHVREFPLN